MNESNPVGETRSFAFRNLKVENSAGTRTFGPGWARIVTQNAPEGRSKSTLIYAEASIKDPQYRCGEALVICFDKDDDSEEVEGRCVGVFEDQDSGWPFLFAKRVDPT